MILLSKSRVVFACNAGNAIHYLLSSHVSVSVVCHCMCMMVSAYAVKAGTHNSLNM